MILGVELFNTILDSRSGRVGSHLRSHGCVKRGWVDETEKEFSVIRVFDGKSDCIKLNVFGHEAEELLFLDSMVVANSCVRLNLNSDTHVVTASSFYVVGL
jgi:hypothetical protein